MSVTVYALPFTIRASGGTCAAPSIDCYESWIAPMPFAVLLQYWLPKRWLTRLAGVLAGRRFVARYAVDMNEAARPEIEAYPSFNEFFGRALHPQARPLHASADWLVPV